MSILRVTIETDGGVSRTFSGHGDGAELVAAFRSWLTSADCQLELAASADAVDGDAASLEVVDFQLTQSTIERWIIGQLGNGGRRDADLLPLAKAIGITKERWNIALDRLIDSRSIFTAMVQNGSPEPDTALALTMDDLRKVTA